jgi:hypothetical protein
VGENGKIAYNASPAGTRIAYDCGAMVCAIDPDGSNHEFWHDNGMPLVALDWAPDATRLALVALSEDWGHPYLYWVATGADPPGGLINSDVSGAYSFPIPCAATAATTIGAECTFDTTAEAIVAGIAKEGRRAVWSCGR